MTPIPRSIVNGKLDNARHGYTCRVRNDKREE